eukprot:scaffold7676_cov138-Isochrysis_galbana.AAC.2
MPRPTEVSGGGGSDWNSCMSELVSPLQRWFYFHGILFLELLSVTLGFWIIYAMYDVGESHTQHRPTTCEHARAIGCRRAMSWCTDGALMVHYAPDRSAVASCGPLEA